MKTALLLSGNARFCAEFDLQLANLQGSEVDWFVTLWDRDVQDDQYISPHWRSENAREKLQRNLPLGHRIANIEIVDPTSCPPLPRDYPASHCNPQAMWNQYWILKTCDNERIKQGGYDLVIRSRPDLGVDQPINLQACLNLLRLNPNIILTPTNNRHGAAPQFCDQFAIGLPETMTVYTRVVDLFDQCYLQHGVPFNQEFILQHILNDHGISWPDTGFTVGLRRTGNIVPDFGRWL
jgi:hypothetical protein